jgi:hypothetical protein
MKQEKKHAVVSLSGGMDSSTLLLRCLKEFDTVTAISFDYGQKHKVELERAQALVDYINETKIKVTGNLDQIQNDLLKFHSITPEDLGGMIKEVKGEAKGLDTAFVDDKYITIIAYSIKDSIKVSYEIKQQLIDTILSIKTITVIDTIVIHKTRQEIRLDARQKRLETRTKDKNEKVFIKQSGRTSRVSIRKEAKGNQLETDSLFSRIFKKIKYFLFALILLLIGFVLGVILKTFRIV